jgi:hypothetical protein
MKKVVTVTLALVALAAFADPAVAQQKGTQKSPPTGVETKQSLAAAKNSAHATEKVMSGKVTEVNNQAKTFTAMANGKEVVFSAATLSKLPTVGEILDITYTGPPGGPFKSISLNSSRSNIY